MLCCRQQHSNSEASSHTHTHTHTHTKGLYPHVNGWRQLRVLSTLSQVLAELAWTRHGICVVCVVLAWAVQFTSTHTHTVHPTLLHCYLDAIDSVSMLPLATGRVCTAWPASGWEPRLWGCSLSLHFYVLPTCTRLPWSWFFWPSLWAHQTGEHICVSVICYSCDYFGFRGFRMQSFHSQVHDNALPSLRSQVSSQGESVLSIIHHTRPHTLWQAENSLMA